jgi:hypothetical protein
MLAPIILTDQEIEKLEQETETVVEPSKTYKFDFQTGQLTSTFIDDEDAIKQAAVKAIYTARSKYLVYSDDYGCEIFYLMGKAFSQEYLQLEVPRLIQEALMPDDRIETAENFVVSKKEDELHISFDLITVNSDDSMKVEVIM